MSRLKRPSRVLLSCTLLLAGGVAALGLASCARPEFVAHLTGADTVYVGVAVGLESPERYVDVFQGVQIALDELNASKPSGAPTLALRRAPGDAKSAVAVAAAFRDDPRVIGVVGHTESAATISAAAVYADRAHDGRDAVVAVSPTAGAPLVTRVNSWVFRVCPVVGDQARSLARFAADSLHVARVGVMYRNDVMGKSFLHAFAPEYESRGGAIVENDPFMEEIPEFDAYARRLVKRGVRGVIFSGNAPEALKLIRALHAAGGSPTIFSINPPDATDSATLREFAGMRYTALYADDKPFTDTGRRFAQTFRQRTGRPSDHWGALGYDAAMLIGRAVQSVGPDRKRVRNWIAGVGTAQPAYSGASGEIRFEGSNDPKDKAILVREVRL